MCGLIWPNLEFLRDFIAVLITCMNEEDPIKMTLEIKNGARVVTTLHINFTDAPW